MKKIIIVDDEVAILEALSLILRKRGYEVDTISNPEDLFPLLDGTLPDIIFVDLSMPGINGESLTKSLKTDKRTRSVPVVVISAHTDIEDRATSAGADGYLEKPFRMGEFLDKVSVLTETTS